MKKFLSLFFIFLTFSFIIPFNAFAEESTEPVPYSKDEFPQWALDLRRFEIVSLGSIPFAMIGVVLVYGNIEKQRGHMSSVPNPLNPSSLDESEQLKILGMTVCTGLAIGFVDFTVNQIIRHNKKKRLQRINAAKQVNVVPVQEEPDEETIENETQNIESEKEEN